MRRFRRAQTLKSELGQLWAQVLDTEPLDTHVTVGPTGTGVVTVSIIWPPGERETLSTVFVECLDELWASLDSLIVETVAMFSVLRTPRDQTSKRYFPVADTKESFEALLAQGCLDGILNQHYKIVRTTQPWQDDLGVATPDRLRAGLTQLVNWTNATESGQQVTARVSPVNPQVEVDAPEMFASVSPAAPSEIVADGTVAATFTIASYDGITTVSAAAGSYIDLDFASASNPETQQGTFESALAEVMDVVLIYAAHFAEWSAEADTPRRLLPTSSEDRGVWLEATSTGRGWEAPHLNAVRDSETGVGTIVGDPTDALTIVVSTPSGVFERRVPPASPLRKAASIGIAAETATRDAVATWGLPDFVMRPLVERKGSGVREISDGILLVGDVGAVIQVKGRNAELGDDAKERRWTIKNVVAACRQIDGSVRRLRAAPATMVNGRNRRIVVDGSSVMWVGVVILEHDAPPISLDTSFAQAAVPVTVLIRRDWEFLFDQLKSTRAVLDYLIRVQNSGRLGEEPHRYFELANLDAKAKPENPNPLFDGLGDRQTLPLLPTEPAGYKDPRAFHLVRRMSEEIAGIVDQSMSDEMRLQVLADIDALPVGHRESLGALLLREMDMISQNPPPGIRWKFRTFLSGKDGGVQVGFGVCSVYNEDVKNAFGAWVQLRHYERRERENLQNARSIGVMLTPRLDGEREWDTTLFVVIGDLKLTKNEVASFTKLWGRRGDPRFAA